MQQSSTVSLHRQAQQQKRKTEPTLIRELNSEEQAVLWGEFVGKIEVNADGEGSLKMV